MDREIKFRVWDGEQMISPDYVDRSGTAHWKSNSIPQRSTGNMQYTGLKDKNGVEIFEGDILAMDDPEDPSVCVVIFEGAAFKRRFNFEGDVFANPFDPKFDCKWWLVAGNIHENPELLNE